MRPSAAVERVPAWSLAVSAMLSVQLGAAVSVSLLEQVGAAGAAWMRAVLGALGFLVIARPRLWRWGWRHLRAPILLGGVTAVMLLAFQAAIGEIPLGTVVAIEFLGPLTVAALHSPTWRALAWPALALGGVLLLTQPWAGDVNLTGVALAAVAGICWGTYIVITQHVGDRFAGIDGLAVSMPVAALLATPFGLPQAWGHIDAAVLLLATACALLAPFLPWMLELYALRRLSKAAFGTLMALEPAIAVAVGAALLHQAPDALRLLGTALVVMAGVGAVRIGRRTAPTSPATIGAVAGTADGSTEEVALHAGRAADRAHP